MVIFPKRVWIEMHSEGDNDACDAIVEMEDGAIYTTMFVTPPYFQRQMHLSYAVSSQIPDTCPVRYCAIETPHIVVEKLDRDTIEDTIDNLIALDLFAGLFTRVTEDEEDQAEPERASSGSGKRATAEVAAVVISDVLVVKAQD